MSNEDPSLSPLSKKPDTPTYVCVDCKANVYDALGVVRERCLTCQWIEDLEIPGDRERLRAWLDAPKI